jgi:hypothetical protein
MPLSGVCSPASGRFDEAPALRKPDAPPDTDMGILESLSIASAKGAPWSIPAGDPPVLVVLFFMKPAILLLTGGAAKGAEKDPKEKEHRNRSAGNREQPQIVQGTPHFT